MRKINKRAELGKLAEIFKALGDPNRMRILCRLFSIENACVSDIAKDLELSIATASYHLLELEEAGILTPTRHGKRISYAPNDINILADLKKLICKYT